MKQIINLFALTAFFLVTDIMSADRHAQKGQLRHHLPALNQRKSLTINRGLSNNPVQVHPKERAAAQRAREILSKVDPDLARTAQHPVSHAHSKRLAGQQSDQKTLGASCSITIPRAPTASPTNTVAVSTVSRTTASSSTSTASEEKVPESWEELAA